MYMRTKYKNTWRREALRIIKLWNDWNYLSVVLDALYLYKSTFSTLTNSLTDCLNVCSIVCYTFYMHIILVFFSNRAFEWGGQGAAFRRLWQLLNIRLWNGAHKIRVYLHHHILPAIRYLHHHILLAIRYLHHHILPAISYLHYRIYYLPSGTYII